MSRTRRFETAPEMLEIAEVRRHVHSCPLVRPFVTSRRRTTAVDYVVAEVVLADGTWGQGSAAETVAVTGEDAASIVAALDGPLGAALHGARGTLAELSGAVRTARRDRAPGATSAAAALDVALADAAARSAGVPLADLLGADPGAERAMVNDMTISLEDPHQMATSAREATASGARILKVKLGRDEEEDRRRLAAVVEAAPHVRLRLDANQGWDAEGAIRLIRGLEEQGLPLDLIEQPVPAADIEGLARVRAAVGTPIMADEALWGPDDARRLIDAGAVDMFNIKLAKTGGLSAALEIADLAREAGIACMVGAMMEPRISIAAAAHLAIAHEAITMIDLDPPAWFASDAPAGGFEDRDGMLRLTGGPGLGLDRLDPGTDPAGPADVAPPA